MMFSRVLGTAASILMLASAAAAQPVVRDFAIAAQPLGAALRAYSNVTGREVIAATALVDGKSAADLTGRYEPDAALDRLLQGSGLHVDQIGGAYIIRADTATAGNGPEIVVTGTRIRGAAPVGAPLTVIDRAAITASGRGTIQGLLETLPANFGGGQNEATAGVTTRNGSTENLGLGSTLNLRGLGSAATLVLFDNNRPALGGTNGTFADVSLIPQIAIDRIEVLTDGASAIYGTDAVAGVVNFRFRNRFEGAETSLRAGTADGDFSEYQLGGILGKRWGTGGIVLAYQYSQRGNLPGADRAYATSDLRRFGGPDYRSRFAVPGTLVAANGAVFGIPDGQDGRGLSAAQLLPGVQRFRDNQREDDLLPAQHSHAIYGSIDQAITPTLSAYGHAFYARREFRMTQPLGSQSPVTVPVGNPFYVDPIGTGEPVTAYYNFAADLGSEYQTGTVSGLTTNGGLTLDLGPWRIDANGNYGIQRTRLQAFNVVNGFRLREALADTNPATAYNVFGDGQDNNPSTIAAVRGGASIRVRNQVWSAALRADGPLIQLPTGTVRLAAGYEHRDERLNGVYESNTFGPDPLSFPLQTGLTHRRIEAVYGEVLVPLAGDNLRWLPGTLDLSVAGRAEWYSDFGRTTNPKVGLSWKPRPGVALRSSYGTSFHAPGFGDLAGTAFNLYQPYELPDPQAPGGTAIALGLFGYAAVIKPERAKSLTAGLDLADWPLNGLRLSATYFHIAYRDRIGTATSDYLSYLTRRDIYGGILTEHPDPAVVLAYFNDPNFSNPLGVTPDQIDVIANALTTNLSTSTVRGLDFNITYQTKLAGGDAALGVSGTRLFAIDQGLTATSPKVNVAGTFGNPNELRLRGKTSWSRGGFTLGTFINYTGAYSNQTVTPATRVKAWATVDARVGYRFADAAPLKGAEISLSLINLFDRDPPFTVTHYYDKTVGYDPEQANPIGRTIAVEVTTKW